MSRTVAVPSLTWAQVRAFEPCTDALIWGEQKFARRKSIAIPTLIEALLRAKREPWANWLIVRCLTPDQQVQYAIVAAETVLAQFERRYPDDMRPRRAIAAAKTSLAQRDKSARAARAAEAAEAAARAAVAAWAAATAAWAAARAAEAAEAARAAEAAEAAVAARAAGAAAGAAAERALYRRIIRYGVSLVSAKASP